MKPDKKWIQVSATEKEEMDLSIFYLSVLCRILVESLFLERITIFAWDIYEIESMMKQAEMR